MDDLGGYPPIFGNIHLGVSWNGYLAYLRLGSQIQRIHVWYIYLHLVDLYGKCRDIYCTIHGSYVKHIQDQELKGNIRVFCRVRPQHTDTITTPLQMTEDGFGEWFHVARPWGPCIWWSKKNTLKEKNMYIYRYTVYIYMYIYCKYIYIWSRPPWFPPTPPPKGG